MRPFYLGWVFPAFSVQSQTLDKRREKNQRKKLMNKWTKESTRITPKNRTKTRTDWRKNEGVYYYLFSRWIHLDGFSKHEQVLAPGHVWWLFLFTYRVMALGWQRHVVENVKELYHASLVSHDLFTWFNDLTSALRLTLGLFERNTHLPSHFKQVEECHGIKWIKRVPHTCLFGCV